MSDLSEEIVAELRSKFERHPVWVWFDAKQKYEGIVDDVSAALAPEVTTARYDGSFLALKRRLWEEDPNIDEQWLFYVPASREDAEWFRDVQRLGRQYRVSADIDDTPVSKYLVANEEAIPSVYDAWGRDPSVQSSAFFCVLFETDARRPDEWLRKYLAAPDDYRDTFEEYAMEDEWTDLLRAEYGVDAGLDARETATQLLFGEVDRLAPTDRFTELAAADGRAAAEFVEDWQHRDRDTFTRYAQEIGDDYDLAGAVVDSDSAEWTASAFPGIDHGLIKFVMQSLAEETYAALPGRAARLYERVADRKQSFWAREDVVDWSLPLTALAALAAMFEQEFDNPSGSVVNLIDSYTDTDGWWRVDAAYREFIRATQEVTEPYEQETTVRNRVTSHYMDFLKSINRPLADALGKTHDEMVPQTAFFERYAEPERGLAVIVCDGLRYELAATVRDRLARHDSFDQRLEAVTAALPSVTEVGMAAHLPGPLELDIDGDELTVSVDGERLDHKRDRDEALESVGYDVRSLTEVADTSLQKLRDSDPTPCVVYSGTIDKLGEGLDDDEAFGRVSDHVDNIERAIQRLRRAGYTEFVVTSDHGFLYTDQLEESLKLDSPSLAPVTKRRFAVAAADAPLVESQEYLSVDGSSLEQLGVHADGVQLLFPRSVACFRARGGNVRYFHGGVSLQELVVPVLRVTTDATDADESISYDVNVPDPITNTIFTVEINAKSERLSFDREPTLSVEARVDGTTAAEPTEMTVTPGANEARVRLKQGVVGGASTVEVRVLDRDTREVIEHQTVGFDTLFGEDAAGFDI